MLLRFIKFNIMFIISALTTPSLGFEDCGQIYKKIQTSCSAQNNQILLSDKKKIDKSTDAAAGAMAMGFTQVAASTYVVCGQLLASCRTSCQAKGKEFKECKEDGLFGREHAKMKDLVSNEQKVIIAGDDTPSKSLTGPKFTGSLGVPSDLGRAGVDNSLTSHDYVLDEQRRKGTGASATYTIPFGATQ